jgi:hypothetical protein
VRSSSKNDSRLPEVRGFVATTPRVASRPLVDLSVA